MIDQENEKDLTTVKFIVPGDPVSLDRARYGRGRDGTAKVYDSQRNEKLMVGITLRSQNGDRLPLAVPLWLDITFYFKKPKHRKLVHIWRIERPDTSNLLKFYEDVGTEAGLWKDDSFIVKVTAQKVYDDNPRTELIVCPIII